MFARLSGKTRSLSRGQGLVEYALILVLVAIVVIIVVSLLGRQIQEVFCDALIGLGNNAPEVEACAAPRVTCLGAGNGATVGGDVPFEADVRDNEGQENITQVQFFLDGSSVRTEYEYRYCMGADPGGGAPCDGVGTGSWSAGPHTIRMVATDSDGNTGECSITVNR